MRTDRYFRRRMAINKFNNRPSFDIKKSDDSTSIEKKRENSATVCCNCEKTFANSAAKSYRNVVKYFEEIDGRYQNSAKNKSKNIIPKIIESFQQVSPMKQAQSQLIKPSKKTDSLHTLYRNSSPIFGKNIPNHKIMKNLLLSCDGESATSQNQNTHFDVIPSRDTNINVKIVKKYPEGNMSNRVNKQTSTTGLVWPISSRTTDKTQFNLNTSKSTIFNKYAGKAKSKIPQIKETHTEKSYSNNKKSLNPECYLENKQTALNLELEYFPTKDNQNIHCHKKIEKTPKSVDKQNMQFINGVNKELQQYKFNARTDLKKEQTYVVHMDRNMSTQNALNSECRKKEKSFVQLQVEKYNKINNNKSIRSKGHISNSINNSRTKNFQDSRRSVNKDYIDIMASMRDKLPNLGNKCVGDSAGDNHDWSDNVDIDHDVKFPKETRTAMETLMDSSRRIPLTKYTKSQNIEIQPAISIASHPKTDYEDYKKPSHRNQLPCSKNLLCSRGNHEGLCKLTKGSPSRYEHRSRTKYKEFVK